MQSFRALLLVALSCVCFHAIETGSPMEKVVKLLKGMKANLAADHDKEKALYEKFSCWCTGMTSEKGAAIDKAKVDLKTLGTSIMGYRAKITLHSSNINDAARDMKINHEAQQTASKTRDLENAAFTALRAEMDQALQSLGQALKMLKMAPQFLQTKTALSAQTAEAVRSAIDAIPSRQLGALSADKVSALQHIGTALAQGTYDPSYGSLVTILEAMNGQFTKDLSAETATENTSKANFESLLKLKVEELVALQAKVDKTEDKKAKAAVDLATTTKTYDNTEAQMTADIKFFTNAVDQCTKKAGAWQIRQDMRTEELAGVTQAIELLTSDAARKLFGKAINANNRVARKNPAYSFMQVESMLPGQEQAFQVLRTQAKSSQSIVLAKIAAQVRMASGGHFDAVYTAIDKVIGVLKTEQSDDNKKKTQCNEDYQKFSKTSADLNWQIEKNDAEIADLEATIATQETLKTETIASIKETNDQLKAMLKQRGDEKTEYDGEKLDDENAVKLINSAKTAIMAFYKKHNIAFLQGDPLRGDSSPEAKLSGKGSRSMESKGIVTLMETLVDGLQDELAVQLKVENMAKADYATSKKAAEDLVGALTTKKTNIEAAISQKQKDKRAENVKKTANEKSLKGEVDYKAQIQSDCDFTINNWQDRFNKRKAEMDGLDQAKAFLAGSSLVQTKRH